LDRLQLDGLLDRGDRQRRRARGEAGGGVRLQLQLPVQRRRDPAPPDPSAPLHAAPDALLDEAGDLDPARAWDLMMRNEKPGGHGERSVAVGVVDMALFDLAAKIAEQP